MNFIIILKLDFANKQETIVFQGWPGVTRGKILEQIDGISQKDFG